MEFVETPTFTRRVLTLLEDESYRKLQAILDARPDAGRTMEGTGGARKIRWAPEGRGKRGGIRVIYYSNERESTCYMLFVFGKNETDNLTNEQKNTLKKYIKEHLK